MKKAFTLIVLACAIISFSQKAKDLTNWNITLSEPNYAIGDEIEIIIAVDIAEHWHMYSSDFDPDCGPIPTEIAFSENDSFELVGELEAINSVKKYDEIFECDITDFTGKGLFKQKIKIKNKELQLKLNGSFQVCQDNGMCLMGHFKVDQVVTPSTSTQQIIVTKE